jgi:hypothetical protein
MGFLADLKMGLGMKEKTQDYKDRTEKTKAINKAVSSGDTSAFKDDPAMMSRYKRESMMSKMGDSNDNSGIKSISNGNATAEDDMADQYAENLRRYNEYMQSQQPQQPTVTPEMRREALNIFESQQGAGQIPYYMAAARNAQNPNMSPAFQYAAQNYDVLGGSQRLAPRPMEMMSVAERQRINEIAQGMEERQAAENDYQAGMDMVFRGGGKGGPRTRPQLPPPGMIGLPRDPRMIPRDPVPLPRFGGKGRGGVEPQFPENRMPGYGGMGTQPIDFPENRMPGYGGMGTQPTSAPPNFASILASRFGGFGGQ